MWCINLYKKEVMRHIMVMINMFRTRTAIINTMTNTPTFHITFEPHSTLLGHNACTTVIGLTQPVGSDGSTASRMSFISCSRLLISPLRSGFRGFTTCTGIPSTVMVTTSSVPAPGIST